MCWWITFTGPYHMWKKMTLHHIPANIFFLCRLASQLQQCKPCDIHRCTWKLMRYGFCCCVEYVLSWTSLDALLLCLFIAVYLCSPCFCVEVTLSLSRFPLVCPSVLLRPHIFIWQRWSMKVWWCCFLTFFKSHIWLSPATFAASALCVYGL